MDMEYLEFPIQKASFNLALEELLFDNLPGDHQGYFILWQNNPAVIIGRNQILQETVDMEYALHKQIPVIRRNTGGGAVYHDGGNLNYTFMEHVTDNKKRNFAWYLERMSVALAALNLKAKLTGRNDLEIDGKKFSGNSQLKKDGKILHHGTILINSDLERMARILKVDESKFRSRGISSLRARVRNLADLCPLSLEEVKSVLIAKFADSMGEIPDGLYRKADSLARNKYESVDWNYGRSPGCTLSLRKRFAWGDLQVQLLMQGGRIRSCKLNGDVISLLPLADLEAKFANRLFCPDSMREVCGNIAWEEYIAGCDGNEAGDFFCRELFE